MSLIRPFAVTLLLALMIGPAHSTSVAELKADREKIEADIATAETQSAIIEGGLLKSLVAARIELLRVNSALLQQRIHAIESGAKISMVVTATEPDTDRLQRIENDLKEAEAQVASRRAENAKLSGGLLKVMQEATIATAQLSLETLRIERFKAKYGIAWMPSYRQSPSQDQIGASQPPSSPPATPSTQDKWIAKIDRRATALLVPSLSNKRYRGSDFRSGVYQDAVLFDVAWDTSGLKKPVRAVKGVVVFADLFGETKFQLQYTINRRLKPGDPFRERQIGFDYNKFRDSHQWMRVTDLDDMKIEFIAKEVIYQDGSTVKLEKRE